MHDKGTRSIQRRDFLNDRHQCSRLKEGRPIKVRVVCQSAALVNPRISSAATLALMEEKAKMVLNSERRSSRLRVVRNSGNKENLACKETTVLENKLPKTVSKSKRAAEIVDRLNNEKKAKEAEAFARSEKSRRAEAEEFLAKARAKEIEAHNKLLEVRAKEAELHDADQQLKNTKLLVVTATSELNHLNNKVEHSKAKLHECQKLVKNMKEVARYNQKGKEKTSDDVSDDEVLHLVKVVEGALCHLKGKHNSTKAKLLFKAVISGKLFNGAVAA